MKQIKVEQRFKYLEFLYKLVTGSPFQSIKHSSIVRCAGLSQESAYNARCYWENNEALEVQDWEIEGLPQADDLVYITDTGIGIYERITEPLGSALCSICSNGEKPIFDPQDDQEPELIGLDLIKYWYQVGLNSEQNLDKNTMSRVEKALNEAVEQQLARDSEAYPGLKNKYGYNSLTSMERYVSEVPRASIVRKNDHAN